MREVDVVVVGGGLAGLAAALAVQDRGGSVVVLEAAEEPGGLARTARVDGYTFDYSGHLLHLAREETKKLVTSVSDSSEWALLNRRSAVVMHDRLVPYPFQLHLAHAPDVVREACLATLPSSAPDPPIDPGSLTVADWIAGWLGAGIGAHFMTPYNEKVSGVPTSELTCHWLGRFVPRPSVEEIRQGALSRRIVEAGYNARFLYPREGGIDLLWKALASRIERLQTSAEVGEVNATRRLVRTVHGEVFRYREGVIASVPLTRMPTMASLGSGVAELGALLRANDVVCVNLGLRGLASRFDGIQWLYLCESRFHAYRIGFYNAFVPEMAPKGRFGVYVEIPGARGSSRGNVDRAVADLVELGAIVGPEDVELAVPVPMPGAYVVHDENWAWARARILDELARRRILMAGRYGRWEYASMEDALWQGIDQATCLLDGVLPTAEARS